MPTNRTITAQVADIVASYVANSSVKADELPTLIKAIHAGLVGLEEPPEAEPAHNSPAISLRRLVTAESVACAECGARFKTIRRHLKMAHGLTPGAYVAKWGLKKDHPMVAPAYAQVRSGLARTIGLGRKAAPEPVKAATSPILKSAVKQSLEQVSGPAPTTTKKAVVRPHPKPSKRTSKVTAETESERTGPREPMFD